MVLRFGILGPVVVEEESGPIEVRGAGAAPDSSAAALGNQPVSSGRMAEDVWDGRPRREPPPP